MCNIRLSRAGFLFDLLEIFLGRAKIAISGICLLVCGIWSVRGNPQCTCTMGDKKSYTLAEVKKHNMLEDAWLVIRDKVYDVTNFINEHPGEDVIVVGLCFAGSDVMPVLTARTTQGRNWR